MPFCLRLDGGFQPEEIEGALSILASRNDALRSSVDFPDTGDNVQIRIADDPRVDFAVLEQTWSDEHAELEMAQAAQNSLLSHPFNFGRAPLWRARLKQVGASRAYLIMAFDHLIFDEASQAIFASQLAGILAGGARAEDEAGSDQYSAWASWQRSHLEVERRELLQYWESALRGTVPFPDLTVPAGNLSAERQFERVVAHVCAEDHSRAVDAARTRGLTPHMTYLAAAAGAWNDLTGSNDFVVHTPHANRTVPQARNSIGWFAHSLPLRFQADSGSTEWLSLTRSVSMGALAHQEAPLPWITRNLQPDSHGRSRRRRRLYFSYTKLEETTWGAGQQRALSIVPISEDDPVADDDLSFVVRNFQESTTVEMQYNPQLIESAFAATLGERVAERARRIGYIK